MDRRAILILGLLIGCGGPPAPRRAEGTAVRVTARGTLAYAVAFTGDRMLTVELTERFELVVRSLDGRRQLGRIELGGADLDWPALAAAGDRAWVGGEAGTVAVIDLDQLEITARWPIGAPVTALAADGELVAIGDATGVLCLRRGDDGALLQCVVGHDSAIAELTAIDGGLRSHGADRDLAWTLPALAVAPSAEPMGLRWGEREVRADGRRVEAWSGDRHALVVEMAGAVHDLAVSPTGELAVAAWITGLDQASVVLVAAPGPGVAGGATMGR